MTYLKFFLAVSFLLFSYVSPSFAQGKNKDEINGFVAGGFYLIPDYEGSTDYQTVPLLAVRVSYNQYYFQTRGLGAVVNISPLSEIEFGPAFRLNMGRDDVDDNRVSRLREIDATVEGGFFIKYPINGVLSARDQFAVNVDYLTDLSDVHEGTQISFGSSYSFSPMRPLFLTTSLNATYSDDDYMNSFFSIDANNASRSGFNQYTAEAGIKDIGINLMANYQFNKKWGVTALVGYKALIGDAADSPIIEAGSQNQFSGGLGLTYQF